MPTYTLFVDESGKFEDVPLPPKQRVLGGVFVPGQYEKLSADLMPDLQVIAAVELRKEWAETLREHVKRYGTKSEDLRGLFKDGSEPKWQQLHWGPMQDPEFKMQDSPFENRKYSTLIAANQWDEHVEGMRNLTREIFDAILKKCPGARFVAVKTDPTSRYFTNGVACYRSMLLDLVACSSLTLDSGTPIDRLDIILSTNATVGLDYQEETCKTEVRTLMNSLQTMLEAGLISQGISTAVAKSPNPIRVHGNHEHPLLRGADFVCAVAANHDNYKFHSLYLSYSRHPNRRFNLFKAFGSPRERRARIYERNGDLPASAIEWAGLVVQSKGQSAFDRAFNELREIISQMLSGPYAFSAQYAMEELIERLDRLRNNLDPDSFRRTLECIESAYQVSSTVGSLPHKSLLFRFRSYMLIQVNHMGVAAECEALIERLERDKDQVARDPSNFASVLRYQVAECDACINNMLLEKAYKAAKDHLSAVNMFSQDWPNSFYPASKTVWSEWESSPIWVRAQWNEWRCATLGLPFSDESTKTLNKALGDSKAFFYAGLSSKTTGIQACSRDDLSRLLAIRAHAHFRIGTYDAAINDALEEVKTYFATIIQDEPTLYDLANCLRAEADAMLFGTPAVTSTIIETDTVKRTLNGITNQQTWRHPVELFLRDAALSRFLLAKSGLRYDTLLDQSDDFLSARKNSSPIYTWLFALNRAVRSFFKNEPFMKKDCKRWLEEEEIDEPNASRCLERWGAALAWKSEGLTDSSAHNLFRLRMASPY